MTSHAFGSLLDKRNPAPSSLLVALRTEMANIGALLALTRVSDLERGPGWIQIFMRNDDGHRCLTLRRQAVEGETVEQSHQRLLAELQDQQRALPLKRRLDAIIEQGSWVVMGDLREDKSCMRWLLRDEEGRVVTLMHHKWAGTKLRDAYSTFIDQLEALARHRRESARRIDTEVSFGRR
jgi:hypothetical protein